MNFSEIKKALASIFERPSGGRIVFWYDGEGRHEEDVDALCLDGVQVVKLRRNNQFAVKLFIEEEAPPGRMLVYSPEPRPCARENWLSDAILYSRVFSSDEASIYMLALGIAEELREMVEISLPIFGSEKLAGKFQSYGPIASSKSSFRLRVLSAVCDLPKPSFDCVVRTVLIEFSIGERACLNRMADLGVDSFFFSMAEEEYGFYGDGLFDLAASLLLSHLAASLPAIPDEWSRYATHNPNRYVFTDSFLKDRQLKKEYGILAGFASNELGLESFKDSWMLDDVLDCETFKEFDQIIVKSLIKCISCGAQEYSRYLAVIRKRKASPHFSSFEGSYLALESACECLGAAFSLKNLESQASSLLAGYSKELYKQRFFRDKFFFNLKNSSNPEEFSEISKMVESACHAYEAELISKWSLLDDESPCISYDLLEQAANDAAMIIIVSPTLSFAKAARLSEKLNQSLHGEISLEAFLSEKKEPASAKRRPELPSWQKGDSLLRLDSSQVLGMNESEIASAFKLKKAVLISCGESPEKASAELEELIRRMSGIPSLEIRVASSLNLASPISSGLAKKSPSSVTQFSQMELSLPEAALPVIRIKAGKPGDKPKTKKTSVVLADLKRKLTSVTTFLSFFQKEPVDSAHLPLRLRMYFESEGGELVSNVNIFSADSASPIPEERFIKARFIFRSAAFQEKSFFLSIEDDISGLVIERLPFRASFPSTSSETNAF
jgi:hypothetical protein